MKAAVYLISAVFLIAAFVFGYAIFDVMANSTEYVFGTGVGGWRYNSYRNYVASIVVSLAVSLVGLGLGFIKFGYDRRIAAQIAALAVLLAWTLLS